MDREKRIQIGGKLWLCRGESRGCIIKGRNVLLKEGRDGLYYLQDYLHNLVDVEKEIVSTKLILTTCD